MKNRILAWLLTLVLAVSLLPVAVWATETEGDHIEEEENPIVGYTLLWEADNYTVYTKNENPWTLANGVFTSGNAGKAYTISNLKVDFKAAGVASFDWTVSGGSISSFAYRVSESDYAQYNEVTSQTDNKHKGEATGTEQGIEVQAGQSLYLVYYRSSKNHDVDAATVTNIQWTARDSGGDSVVTDPIVYDESMGSVSVQWLKPEIDSYDGKTYTSMTDVAESAVENGNTYRLKAIPKEGYQFYGWIQEYTYNNVEKRVYRYQVYYTWGIAKDKETANITNKKVDIKEPELEVTFDGTSTYRAVFKPEGSVAFRVNSQFYDTTADLAQVLSTTKNGDVVELLQDTTLSKDITVPKGVTLYVPYRNGWGEDESLGKYRTFGTLKGIDETKHYVTLTVNEGVTLTVKGTLAVGGTVGHRSQGYQGNLSGAHGYILNNGNIVMTEKGTMTCYGLVQGTGTVRAENNGVIKENLLILDFAGGSNTLSLYADGLMPFERYNMQNIQCKLEVERYGVLTGMIIMYANSTFYEASVDIVGNTENSIFVSNNTGTASTGTTILTRTYQGTTIPTAGNAMTAGVGKTNWILNGGLTFRTLIIDLGFTKVSTSAADFPINCHMDFTVKNGNYEIPGKLKILPGASVTVSSDATLTVSGKMIVVDRLVQGDMSGYRYPTPAELQNAYGYSTANLYVNGTLRVTNGATFGGLVQSTSDTGILVIEEGAYLTNSGDLNVLDATKDLSEQSGYQEKNWIQQVGGVGHYDDNTVWLNLPARVYDGEAFVALQPGTYGSAADTNTVSDAAELRWCSNGVTVSSKVAYTGGTRVMTYNNEAFDRTVKGTWTNRTAAVEITTNTVAGGDKTGVTVEPLIVGNTDGSATLTLRTLDADGNEVTVKYVHLVKYATASDTVTVTPVDGAYTIPADAKSVSIESAMLGDVNMDGYVTSADAAVVLRVVAQIDTPTEVQTLAAEVNGDGYVTSADAAKILRVVAQIDDGF